MTDLNGRPAPWRIEIVEGPNAGAIVPLPEGRYRVGGDLGNDVVLADPSVAAEQLAFEIGPAGAAIVAFAPGAAARRRDLRPGRTQMVASGSEIRLGNTTLRLSGPTIERRRPSNRLAIATSVALVLLAAGAGYRLASPSVAEATPGRIVAPADRAPTTLAWAAASFTRYLHGAPALQAVAVVASGDALIASGSLMPERRSDWLEAQQWFDARFGTIHSLVDRVRFDAASSRPPLAVAAVSTFPVPVAITRDGQRYTEGAVLDGGWVIRRITMGAITLSRGSQVVRVTL